MLYVHLLQASLLLQWGLTLDPVSSKKKIKFKKKTKILVLQQLLVALRVSGEKTLEQLRVRKKMTRVAPGRFGENSKQAPGN